MKVTPQEHSTITSFFNQALDKGAIEHAPIIAVHKLTGDASSRNYYRLQTTSANYIVCLDQPFSAQRHPFLEVHQFLQQTGVRVPVIYDYDGPGGLLLEEDLGDHTLLAYSKNFTPQTELTTYKKCVDIMLKFQSTSLKKKSYSFQQLQFDQAKLDREVSFSIHHFLSFLAGSRSAKWSQDAERIKSEFKQINQALSAREKVFTHRDFHSRNIVVKQEELVVIDFQDARMGLPQYDLVSLLEDCYYGLDHANKENLKKYYFSQLPGIANDQRDYQSFSHHYDLATIQRVFKAIGTFAFIFNTKSDARYLKYIGFALEKIKKIMQRHPSLHPLKESLLSIYYEN